MNAIEIPEPSGGPWKVVRGEYSGDDWLIASFGADDTGPVHVTTDYVKGDELSTADQDAAFVVWARNNYEFLRDAYIEAVNAGRAPAPDVSWSEWHEWRQKLYEWNRAAEVAE